MTKRERKAKQRESVQARAREAIKDLYHNANVVYPRCETDFESDLFRAWFQDVVSSEIDYIQFGGAYPDIAGTCLYIRSQYKSADAANRAESHYRMQARLERSRHVAAWECISEFGELSQYGRGGRTLAPKNLMRHVSGGSYNPREDFFEEKRAASYAELTRSIVIIESFNAYIQSWCESVASQWEEYKIENGLDLEIKAEPVRRRILESLGESFDSSVN